MHRARWRDRVGPPSILSVTALLLAAFTPAAISALSKPSRAVDCASLSPAAVSRAALATTRVVQPRVAPRLDNRGEITGRTLSVAAGGRDVTLTLPVESWIASPVGDVIVYTRHTPATGSEVRAIEVATGCDARLATPAEIVRSALLARSASAVYSHSVTRIGRADAGVTRHDLATGESELVVRPLRPPDGFGPIFGTSLRWGVESDALAVQSCGFSRCLTRVLEPASGKVSEYDHPTQGAFIGLTARHLVTFAACPGLPCAVLSTDLASGDVSVLADEASAASVSASAGGSRLVIDSSAGRMEVAQ